MFRDMFVFQCFIGCRFGDLMRLTNGSVIDGVLEYIAHKTMKHDARTIRVPLSKTAMTIYERYRGVPTKSLFPHYNVSDYNKGIREVLRTVGINRIVSVLDPVRGRMCRSRSMKWQPPTRHARPSSATSTSR